MKIFTLKTLATAMAGCVALATMAAGLMLTPQQEQSTKFNLKQPVVGVACAQTKVKPVAKQLARAAAAEDGYTVVIDEDFSRFTAGSETEPFMDLMLPEGYYQGDPYLSDDWTAQPGWWGMGIYQAGGTCYLGSQMWGYTIGQISTPVGNYQGKVVITLRAKIIEGATKDVQLTLALMDGAYSTFPVGIKLQYESLVAGEDWKELRFECENSTPGDEQSFQINLNYQQSGVLIDDVKVAFDNNYVYAPTGVTYNMLTPDSFEASWNAVRNAVGYELRAYTEVSSGGEDVEGEEDFNSPLPEPENGVITLENGLQIVGGSYMAEGGVNATGGWAFEGENCSITTPYTGSMLTQFVIDFIPRNLEGYDRKAGTGVCEFMGFNGSKWVNIATAYLSDFPIDEEYTYDFALMQEMMPSWNIINYYQIRCDFKGIEPGTPMVIDNVEFTAGALCEREDLEGEFTTTDTKYVFTGLNPDRDYYFQVRALSATGEYSEWSDVVVTIGQLAPQVLPATDIDRRGGYTANWEKAPKATYYVVTNYLYHKALTDEVQTICSEDFSSVKSTGTFDQPVELYNMIDFESLDQYTNAPGWQGLMVAYMEGAVGCSEDPYGIAQMLTPYMDLSSNEGQFTVTIKGHGIPTDYIIVQAGEQYDMVEVGYDGTYEKTFNLTGGTDVTRCAIYSYYQQKFFIQSFEVTQSLAAGTVFYKPLSNSGEIKELSYRFTGLEPLEGDDLYAYNVKAYHKQAGQPVVSEASAYEYVDFNGTSGVEAVAADANSSVRVESDAIVVTLANEAEIVVADTTGRVVASVKGDEGENTVANLEKGIYIVVVKGNAVKVVVR